MDPPRLGSQLGGVAQGSDDRADALDDSEVQHRLGREIRPWQLVATICFTFFGPDCRFSQPNQCNVDIYIYMYIYRL